MGYQKIDNLYKNQLILQFEEVWALEKIHGTSAHIKYTKTDDKLTFFSGGESHEKFKALFDEEALLTYLKAFDQNEIIVHGEVFGGKCQGMSETYGKDLRFVAFDVKMAGNWLDVPDAEALVKYLKLDFVPYHRCNTRIEELNAEKEKPSEQAVKNGIQTPKLREGIVLRPIRECVDERGNRIIAKYKNAEFCETKKEHPINPDKQIVLKEAQAIADEWVTENRLQHVIDQAISLQRAARGHQADLPLSIEDTGIILGLMREDVKREGKGEWQESKEALKAISNRTAKLFRAYLEKELSNVNQTTSDRREGQESPKTSGNTN